MSVKYLGDTKYSNITSDIILFEVSKISDFNMDVYYDSKLVVNGSMVDSGATNQLIISVELPKNAVGNVSLFIDGHFVNSINATKNLIFALGDYPTGIHNVSLIYTGDNNYNSSKFEFISATKALTAVSSSEPSAKSVKNIARQELAHQFINLLLILSKSPLSGKLIKTPL